MKATGFKFLRINCWNITQVIWICKIFSSTLTSYYIQSYLKDKCIKPPPLGMYEYFKTAEAATGGVPKKGCSQKFRNIHKKTPVLERPWYPWYKNFNQLVLLVKN